MKLGFFCESDAAIREIDFSRQFFTSTLDTLWLFVNRLFLLAEYSSTKRSCV